MADYQTMLREKGVKATYQRMKVLEYLDRQPCHPTVDEIYHALRTENPMFSKTTVYNTIDTLEAHGLLSCVMITGKEVHCETRTDSHHHLLCRQCHEIFNIDIPCSLPQRTEIDGHLIEQSHGYFFGICKQCRS